MTANLKEYASQGDIKFKPVPPQVHVEMHFCTAMLDQKEAFEAMVSFYKAAYATWGDHFKEDLLTVIELL